MNANVISTVTTQQKEFTDNFTKHLVTTSLRNIIEKAIPLDNNEKSILERDNFKIGLNAISNNIASNYVDTFKKIGVVPSGNFFDSMVGCISNHVSMESEFRMQEIINDIKLGKIDINNVSWRTITAERFKVLDFKNADIKKRFKNEFNAIISFEESGIIENIKEEVKNSIAEAEAKSEIVEETIKEVNEVKKQMEPPTTKELKNDDLNSTNNNEDENLENENNVVQDNKEEVTAESIAAKFIPILPRKLKDLKIPDVLSLSTEFFRSSGNIDKEVRIRLDSLKLALSTENLTGNTEYLDSYKELEEKTTEALNTKKEIDFAFTKLGLTQNGMFKKDIIALESAKNIIERFIIKCKQPDTTMKDFTSVENILANAFDIIHIKRNLKEGVYKDATNDMINELDSRESAFYKNLVNITDPAIKEAANNVMKLSDIKLEKAVNANFIKDYKINVWEMNVGTIKNVNEEVFSRVSNKLEKLWGRKLTKDEEDIIRATTNNEDATEIVPTEFEKFVIKFGKDEIKTSKESGGVIEFNDILKKRIFLKAKVYTTVYKSLEHLGILNSEDKTEFEKFINNV